MNIKPGELNISKGVTEKLPFEEIASFIERFIEGDFGDFNAVSQDGSGFDGFTGRYTSREGIVVIVDHDSAEEMTIVALPGELE